MKIKLLLVEDQELIAIVEKKELERYGYEVDTVNSGEKALETFKANTDVDLILMDIDLGKGINGIEAAKQILDIKEVPLVFLSSHTDKDIVEKTEKVTSYGYVVKNSGITVLDASIKMAIKLYSAKNIISESEKKYRSFFETARDGAFFSTVDGKLLDCNHFFVNLLGLFV